MRTRADENHPGYRALMELLRTADTVWNASRVFFERWDLSPSQFNVLNLLRLNPAGLSQTDLSRQLIMHRSNLTGLVDRLEKRGLVARREVAADRRAYSVVLTAAGNRLLRDILPRYYEEAARVWDRLPARRAAELIADLQQVAQNVATHRGQTAALKPSNERLCMPAFISILFWVMVAAAAFHAAYASANGSFLIVLYLFALLQLAQTDRWRKAFYPGLAVGLLIAAVRLEFFWRLFSGGAARAVASVCLLDRLVCGVGAAVPGAARPEMGLAAHSVSSGPGLEYFRSELYYLRFSWLNVGYAFAGAPWQGALKPTGNLRRRLPAR